MIGLFFSGSSRILILFPFLCFFAYTDANAQLKKASAFIDSFCAGQPFNGVILIDQPSQSVYRKATGFANLSFKVPNSVDTRFKIASITKLFTSVLVLQLAEKEKLQLDQPFGNYIPGFRGPAGKLVTVRQLLNMTSGLRNIDEGISLEKVLAEGIEHYQRPFTLDQLIDKFANDTLVAKPGSRWDYNNLDYLLLGKIVESVSGKTFAEALREQILIPLIMDNTGMLDQATVVDRLADTYFFREDLKCIANDIPVYRNNWYAAGSMYSTVDDLALLSRALFTGNLLKPESLAQLVVSGEGEYGLGVWVYKDYKVGNKNYTLVKRPGSIMGAQAMLIHVLEKGVTVIILSNTGTVSMDDLGADIVNRLLSE